LVHQYFEVDCDASGCEERYSENTPEEVEQAIEKHYMEKHPERYISKASLPLVRVIRVSEELENKMFPRSYDTAYRESMK
jgi:hypothetical protein